MCGHKVFAAFTGFIGEMATAKKLDELKECPICAEVYIDPRVLPCGHTICFKCIAMWCENKPPGDEVACPYCRTVFTIPSSGVGGLPKNFFAADFLQMKELTIRIPKKSASASRCDQHEDESLKIYCRDCKVVTCTICFIDSHNGHRCLDVSEVVGEFIEQMRTDIKNVKGGADRCRDMLRDLDKERKRFSEQIKKHETQSNKEAKLLKQENQRLSVLQVKRMEEIERVREEIEMQLARMESFKESVNELIEKGASSDIARGANDLHESANKLVIFDTIERSLAELGQDDVTFSSSNDVRRTVGGGRCQES